MKLGTIQNLVKARIQANQAQPGTATAALIERELLQGINAVYDMPEPVAGCMVSGRSVLSLKGEKTILIDDHGQSYQELRRHFDKGTQGAMR